MESEDESDASSAKRAALGNNWPGNGWLGTPLMIATVSVVLAVINAIGHRWTFMTGNLLVVAGMILTFLAFQRARRRAEQ
ncbi:hypothetical protein [Microlunatus sagamiharensis]|uniref:hypothetical protein n=1 Tax=Microlunatus sagamiharensis TaxID=546874 RepID=UPI000B86A404|nr:hypothetical protein [Microlunatus sagamiharensis]